MKDLNLKCTESALDCIDYRDAFALHADVESKLLYTDSKVENPVITIGIPAYNARAVNEAIQSAIDQKDAPAYEIVVVDNHSDKTDIQDTIRFAESVNSHKISIYQNGENVGMYGNWNKCIENAKGKYFVMVHSDDLLVETCLKDLWDLHQKIEDDAAIITRDRHTYMDGTLVSEYKERPDLFGGLLKHKPYARRNKMDLLDPHGNGCGHLLSIAALKDIGGYGPGGDYGCMLNYQLKHPVYDLYKITRIKRIGENETVRVVESFRDSEYFQRKKVIERCFNNSKFLHYISRLIAENQVYSEYGVGPLRKLNFFEINILRIYYRAIIMFKEYSFKNYK